MIKRTSIWLVSLGVVALLAMVGLHLLQHRQTPRVIPPDSNLAEQSSIAPSQRGASAARDAGQPGRPQAIANRSGLHQRLLAMTEPQRNQIFYLIIRDTGANCTEVISSEHFIAESAVWHAHCADAQNYSIAVDDSGSTMVRPVPYEDVPPIFTEPL